MNQTLSQDNRRGQLKTVLGHDRLLLLRMDGQEELAGAFEWRVEALSSDGQVDLNQLLGTHATVQIDMQQDTRYFDGIVCEASYGGVADGGFRYDLVLRPWLHLAGLRRNQKIFHRMTVVDILNEIFANYASVGNPYYEMALTQDYPKLEYTVQYNESDADFATRLMERFGITWCYVHKGGAHVLTLIDQASSLPEIGGGSRPFMPLEGHNMGKEEHFWEWRGGDRVTTGSVRLNEYNFKTPNATLQVDFMNEVNHLHADIESYDYPGDYLDGGAGQGVATRRQEAEAGQGPRHYAVGDVPGMAAGVCVSLTGDLVPGATGKRFACIGAKHRFRAQAYASGDVGGDDLAYQGEYVLMPDDTPMRPERRTKRPIIQGPQTAFVVGSGEIDCDEYGRILVLFHWDLEKANSMRCRVSQNWASRGWGGMVVPRIGMEVIVEHLEGDPDKPIVTGCVYNALNMPPAALPDNKSRSIFKSKSHEGEGFNELTFEDQAGEEFIYLHAQKNLDMHVLNSAKRRVDYDDNVSVGNDSNLDVAANRTETVDGDMGVQVSGGWAEHAKSGRGAQVDGDYKIKTGGDFIIKAGGEIVLDASKITLVGGGAAITLQGAVNVSPMLHVGNASPSAAATPSLPAVLKAAAGEGAPFVSHCPMKDG